MKKFLLATAAVAALTTAVPASAQVGDILRQGLASILGTGGSSIEPQLRDLNNRIQSGYQRGSISQTEASRLQNELRSIAQLEQQYRQDGINRAEQNDLQQRLRLVESRIQQASYGDNRYDNRYDNRDGSNYDNRDGNYDRDYRDDREDGYDRNGRWDNNDGRNGRDCPPGLAKKHNGCQPPGQAKRAGDRYNNQNGRVPDGYADRYRDTQQYIYRYNDGRIYQVDRYTNRIVRVITVRR